MSPDVARRGLACRSAAAIMAGRGLTWPDACSRWLPVWLPESRSNANVRTLIAEGQPVSVAPGYPRSSTARSPPSRTSPATSRPSGGRLDLVADFGDSTVRLSVTDTPSAHDSNHAGQPPPRTNRLSWHGCDSAFPLGPTHRQTDHGPCTFRTQVTPARDGHLASVATA